MGADARSSDLLPTKMLLRPSSSVLPVLLLLLLFLAYSAGFSYSELADSLNHDEFVPRREKKEAVPSGVAKDDLLDMNESTFPPEYDVEDDNKEDKKAEGSATTSEHTYYNMTTINNNQTLFDATYVDVAKWISKGGAEGNTKHEHLGDAYRKAAGVRLKFEFPFYGHRLSNLTIATGGFLYVGDQTHSWLAATQYIAPLMANFDTMADNSSIQYGDDGKRMVVEWRDVTLRDNREAGQFTFQVHLWRDGNITFVYKQVPVPVANISDAQHPCKLGISDAYLFNHKVSSLSQAVPQNKRVIHEYHRITISPENIQSNTIVMLKALPTCLEATSCEQCIGMQLKAFKCSWCNPKDSGKGPWKAGMAETGEGGRSERPFCSDQLGLHRRRQEWIEGNCQLQEENQYCKADEPIANTTDASHSGASSAAVSPDGAPPSATTVTTTTTTASTASSTTAKAAVTAKAKRLEGEGSGGGLAFVTMFILLGMSVSVWLLYAYFNPHTRSGQLLIKYRPSKWQIPSSHVRYSASVHM
uniref:Plexin domain-containing protein 2 n=1 Tax=Globodera rostochiensis TaxID=31243 RepID=A0A914GWX5_GLORO